MRTYWSRVIFPHTSLLNFRCVTGYDIDDDALAIANQNLEDTELNEEMDLIKVDISQLKLSKTKYYDTIIMNPPFGTRKAGIDVAFLKKGLEVTRDLEILLLTILELFWISLFYSQIKYY